MNKISPTDFLTKNGIKFHHFIQLVMISFKAQILSLWWIFIYYFGAWFKYCLFSSKCDSGLTSGVACLNHELLDASVKYVTVVVGIACMYRKILHRFGHSISFLATKNKATFSLNKLNKKKVKKKREKLLFVKESAVNVSLCRMNDCLWCQAAHDAFLWEKTISHFMWLD